MYVLCYDGARRLLAVDRVTVRRVGLRGVRRASQRVRAPFDCDSVCDNEM